MSSGAGEVVLLDEEGAKLVLRHIVWYAYHRWSLDGQECDINEYLDAGVDAFALCLVRFDATRGFKFMTYFDRKLGWAMVSVARDYAHWRYRGGVKTSRSIEKALRFEEQVELAERLALLPDVIRRYAHALLQGSTGEEFAKNEGRSEAWISQKIKEFRSGYLATGS